MMAENTEESLIPEKSARSVVASRGCGRNRTNLKNDGDKERVTNTVGAKCLAVISALMFVGLVPATGIAGLVPVTVDGMWYADYGASATSGGSDSEVMESGSWPSYSGSLDASVGLMPGQVPDSATTVTSVSCQYAGGPTGATLEYHTTINISAVNSYSNVSSGSGYANISVTNATLSGDANMQVGTTGEYPAGTETLMMITVDSNTNLSSPPSLSIHVWSDDVNNPFDVTFGSAGANIPVLAGQELKLGLDGSMGFSSNEYNQSRYSHVVVDIVVPEPAALSLVCLGAFLPLLRRRRK